jgi:hypothetical protein
MIYYLDEAPGGSWADHVLARLGYDADPTKLKFIIKLLFETIKAKDFQAQRLNKKSSSHADTQVLPFPLFEVLDGSDTNDYVQRVEPSVQGGRKIASALLDFIAQHTPSGVGVSELKN